MLFPVPPSSGLVGIARLAEQSRVLEEKRRVEYRELETRRIIGRVSGQRMPFEWTVNPYRGCEFGCKYCYARYTHEFMELRETEQFETRIFAKHFDPVLFRREVARIPEHESIAIGTATDPYQPAERRYRTTRRILEVLAECRGRHIGMVTKSDLVARDARLLAEIGRRNTVWVNLTVTTTDEALARVLEPYAPRPSLRFRALQELASNGIDVTVLCCPVMPLINDSEASISAVAEQASSSGAAYMYGNVLFLKPCAQKAFFPMLEQHFPHLTRRYRERYAQGSGFIHGPYIERIRERMHTIRTRYGLVRKPAASAPPPWAANTQLDLFTA